MMRSVFFLTTILLCASSANAQRQMENLDRGVVAVNLGDGKVYIGWRMLGTEPDGIAFNVYRNGVKVNDKPIANSTNLVDEKGDPNVTYTVHAIINGSEGKPSAAAKVWKQNYLSIHLQTPPGYSPNDASVGDLDGDGAYEIVLHQTGRSRDNSQRGMTDEPILQAYKLDGTLMWSINLGKNIRDGAHYTQFIVYDLDGDGRAEMVCKTADGTVDGKGKVIGDPNANYVNDNGMILDGPEFLTVFDGRTGAALATTDYIPPRGGDGSAWGDRNGNRVDRFLACIAYVDGQRPSVVMCRGYYTRAVLVAWNWRDGKLTREWTFDTDDGTPGNEKYRGQGNHNLSVGDVDGDDKDEIVYGACVIDHDGKGLYSTGLGHGDAMHFSDLDPNRPGLEVFQVHERPSQIAGAEFRDARTGELIWGKPSQRDNGRGMSGDIDPRYKGYECWSAANPELFNCKGEVISQTKPRSCNFKVWWDGDPLCELLDRNRISKWNWTDGSETTLLTAEGCTSNNGTKATPCLCADILGDWREEVIWRTVDNQELRIYTTTIPTDRRIYTLMHDPIYRLSVAWQNVAYNQPTHTGFYLGDGMAAPPRPNVKLVGAVGSVPVRALDRTPYGVTTSRQMENLDRGVVAVNLGDGKVYVGWRMLGTEPEGIAFNVYRNGVKVNDQPITDSTNLVDERGDPNGIYAVRAIVNGSEGKPSAGAKVWSHNYLSVPLQTPNGYTPNDASVGDLDGDGVYDIVLHQAGRGADNASNGRTAAPILEAYKMDGSFLWRINLGTNIREGAHYTQFMVYDLDGDGRAEVACKTADGTVDGKGKVIGDPNANWVASSGKILSGPEYFTIFDGLTGAALATTDYIPPRGDIGAWGGVGGNGGNDNNGNRADRMLACVAHLDGVRPSVVMCRGYYGRSVLAGWDWRDGKLTSRWVFDSAKPGLEKYSGMGNHNLTVADVDGDGKDEIIYGSMCVDDNGTGLYSTNLRHGDAMHVSDLDPSRPGLEVWGIHENEAVIPGYENNFGAAMFDAKTGEILWGKDPGIDVGRGVAADIDPTHPGAECWGGSGGLRDCKGQEIGPRPRSQNFLIWWDDDLLRELLDSNRISKWDWKNGTEVTLFTADGCMSNNGSKSTPALSADLFGDWREEVMFRTRDNKELRIYTTTIPTKHRFYTLMHDPQYRLSIAWQNVAYNQPPHVGFFLGEGMATAPRPSITLVEPRK